MMLFRAMDGSALEAAHMEGTNGMSSLEEISARQRSYRASGEASFARRMSAMEELGRSLPEGGASAPADWDPRRPEKSAWREGAGSLELTPMIIALEWGWTLRGGIAETLGLKDGGDHASKEDAASVPLAVVAPASCLWRFSTPNEWRTLCSQAATLAGNRKTAALTRLLLRARPMLEGLGDAWREEGAGETSMVQHYAPSDSGGFALAALARINPGSLALALDTMEGARGTSAQARRGAALRGVADRLIHELGAGWVIEGSPGKDAQHFLLGPWGEDCEAKKEALEACAAFWEAKQLSEAAKPVAAMPKARSRRI